MKNPFSIVKDFEDAVAEYTQAPYCVAVNSCTNALFLALTYWKRHRLQPFVHIPKYTYISVPMQAIHAGYGVVIIDQKWSGEYQLYPTPVWDSARRFTSNMYRKGMYQCTSHHWNKILGIQQGGCILHDDKLADQWFRCARFDGRTEGVPPSKDAFKELGWHCYMSPEIAAEGLVRLLHLPKNNFDLQNDFYPDLSQIELFK